MPGLWAAAFLAGGLPVDDLAVGDLPPGVLVFVFTTGARFARGTGNDARLAPTALPVSDQRAAGASALSWKSAGATSLICGRSPASKTAPVWPIERRICAGPAICCQFSNESAVASGLLPVEPPPPGSSIKSLYASPASHQSTRSRKN